MELNNPKRENQKGIQLKCKAHMGAANNKYLDKIEEHYHSIRNNIKSIEK